MTLPNDVLVNGQRVSNLFSTRDEDWHNSSLKPIRSLYSMTRALDAEVHVDKMLEDFMSIVEERFAKHGKEFDMAEYVPFCKRLALTNSYSPNK